MKGWRGPAYEGEFPTLGWRVLDHASKFLPSPSDQTQPFVFTDEQARMVLEWYRLHPTTGRFVYRRGKNEQAKGWGKSPFGAVLAIEEFVGPVCFDGWDDDGEPIGVPWGTGDRPAPWVQIAAVSEDQTDNTYAALYEMLTANDNRAAQALGIDQGRTRLYLRDRPGRLEPVTASAGSREGQRVTFALMDETHLWLQRNGGLKLARTLRRNAAKMSGRTLETTNAPVLGEKSVAELTDAEEDTISWANRPSSEPQPDWPAAKLKATLKEVYRDASWIDLDRLVAEIADPATPWDDAVRFYFNIRSAGAGRAVDPRVWDALAKPRSIEEDAYIALGFDGSISRDSTVLRACTADGYSFVVKAWVRPAGDDLVRWLNEHPGEQDWKVDRKDVNQTVRETFARYRVGRMLCDPPKWYSEIEMWAEEFGKEIVLALDTNSASRFAPAVDRWLTAIREGTHTHDGDDLTSDHVRAAYLKKVRLEASEEDGRTKYLLIRGDDNRQIDGAIADVLAHEAALTMPPEPGPAPTPEFFTV